MQGPVDAAAFSSRWMSNIVLQIHGKGEPTFENVHADVNWMEFSPGTDEVGLPPVGP
jgi:hypothetical protein